MLFEKIALIYDNTLRPETTGGYCKRALDRIVPTDHFLPGDLDKIPRDEFDLFINIDDGLKYRWPKDLQPSVYWAIDTHIDFPWSLEKCRWFDIVFAAQMEGAEKLRENGIVSATWLPLACDPGIHRKHGLSKKHNVAFVGNLFPGPRNELLQSIQKNFSEVKIARAYFDEMARIFSASKIVFNRSVENDLNMRVFEALSCGSLLITNELDGNGQLEFFQDGVHLATYKDEEELIEKIRFYLEHDDIREKIAKHGCAEAIENHSYSKRMQCLLYVTDEKLRHKKPFPQQFTGSRPAHPETISIAKSEKDPQYFEFPRPEILELVPQDAKRVLDVGCGAGALGASIKHRQTSEVWGIEADDDAASLAEVRLDRVLFGDVESLSENIPHRFFDCIIFGDVLEHLQNPDELLQKAKDWLQYDGIVVASIPNVRNHSVVKSLLAGNWTYESAGLLDKTHLHFFTRQDIEEMFRQAGFQIEKLQFVPDAAHRDWVDRNRVQSLAFGEYTYSATSAADAEEFFVYQFLVTASPSLAHVIPRSHDLNGLTNLQDEEKSISTESLPFTDWTFSQKCWETIRPLLQPGMKTLECGSGLSTLLFEAVGCDHLALEHDPRWAARCESVRLVPLKGTPRWYDWQPANRFDLILIDGPPGYIGRRGILNVLEDCLHSETILVLDDTNRDAEHQLTEEIANRFGYEFEFHDTSQRQFAIGRRPSRVAKEFQTDLLLGVN